MPCNSAAGSSTLWAARPWRFSALSAIRGVGVRTSVTTEAARWSAVCVWGERERERERERESQCCFGRSLLSTVSVVGAVSIAVFV